MSEKDLPPVLPESDDAPVMVPVQLKRSVERFGFVYKPGFTHMVTPALAEEFGDAVIDPADLALEG